MPGIVGLIARMPGERALGKLDRMLKAMQHLPTYVSGRVVDEAAGIYCGWVARDGSFGAKMPVVNETNRLSLVFSGEEFPNPGTTLSLRRAGHAIDDNPASYLVHLAEEDQSFPACLNGRFHGLLVDGESQTATLFNDRYGMHRIYYHESAEGFYFAAEAKAILAVCPELREMDPKGMGEFVSCGCVLEDRTVFKGIGILPAASSWKFRNGRLDGKGQVLHASGMGRAIALRA